MRHVDDVTEHTRAKQDAVLLEKMGLDAAQLDVRGLCDDVIEYGAVRVMYEAHTSRTCTLLHHTSICIWHRLCAVLCVCV